jgi:L-alanine-DL-glutamate epimerase-like enolase superfamily enzyme
MRITSEPLDLYLRTTFTIAHGASDVRHNVLIRIDEGLGEAPIVPYYNETPQGVMDYIARVAPLVGDDPFQLEDILARLPRTSAAGYAASVSPALEGIDVALHDLVGKRLGLPLYKLFGLNPARAPETSFTISIDQPEVMAARAKESGLPILKIKVGAGNDVAMVRAIRHATNARLRLDANAGWTREQAAGLIPQLADYDIEFVEQPLAREDWEGLRWLKSRVSAPIFADESAQTEKDLPRLAGAIDGVVVKLMKTGGLRGALRTVAVARALDMQVMLSCMVESAVGVTAAAHIAPLADYCDLDGPLLIANDPFVGLRYEGAKIILPDGPGLGLIANDASR